MITNIILIIMLIIALYFSFKMGVGKSKIGKKELGELLRGNSADMKYVRWIWILLALSIISFVISWYIK